MKNAVTLDAFQVVKLDSSLFDSRPEAQAGSILGAVDNFTQARGIELTSEDFLLYMRKRHVEDALKEYRRATAELVKQVGFLQRRLARLEKRALVGEADDLVAAEAVAVGL
jgi:hypothetical protein